MRCVSVEDYEIAKTVYSSPYSHLFTVKNDGFHVGKTVSKLVRGLYGVSGTSYEDKIKAAEDIVDIPEIYKPTAAIYDENVCVGYFQHWNGGVPFLTYESSLNNNDRQDLYRYADLYTKLERIVKKGHEQGLIFPDLLSLDNLFIDKNGNLSLVDFDGLQIKDKRCISISSYLGTEYENNSPKYFDSKTGLWTEELDKKSLLYFYFLITFGLDLSAVGKVSSSNGQVIKLRDLLNIYGLNDEKIIFKIERIISDIKTGDYFGDSVFDIADNYDLLSIPSGVEEDVYYKVLTPKR